jgi:hypothetical protein
MLSLDSSFFGMFGSTVFFCALWQNFEKATISFVMPVRPSGRKEQLGSHSTDFHEFWCMCIFRKYV